MWLISFGNVAKKEMPTPLKLHCTLALLMYFYTDCSRSRGGTGTALKVSRDCSKG